jgi:hypothetical protein
MKNAQFKRKLELVKVRVNERTNEEMSRFQFPSIRNLMTEEQREIISEAQSQAMKRWWASLNADQREEMLRRIKEGRARTEQKKVG